MSAGAAPGAQTYHVYADGSCLGNPGPGGWAAVIVKPDGASRTIYGGDPSTTNNRMELTAAIEGLRVIPAGARVVMRSDSQYLVKTMTLGWKRNMNSDLWLKLDHEAGERKVRFEWVERRSRRESIYRRRRREEALTSLLPDWRLPTLV